MCKRHSFPTLSLLYQLKAIFFLYILVYKVSHKSKKIIFFLFLEFKNFGPIDGPEQRRASKWPETAKNWPEMTPKRPDKHNRNSYFLDTRSAHEVYDANRYFYARKFFFLPLPIPHLVVKLKTSCIS